MFIDFIISIIGMLLLVMPFRVNYLKDTVFLDRLNVSYNVIIAKDAIRMRPNIEITPPGRFVYSSFPL